MKVSQTVDSFIIDYWNQPAEKFVDPGEPKINVQAAVSWLTFAYEKLRSVIDYQQDHLLRKNAIARFLKRRIYAEGRKENFAPALLTELIHSGYLPNNRIPERVIGEIEPVITRYRIALSSLAPAVLTKEHRSAADWILSVCAVELEYHLVEHARQTALADFMYQTLRQDFNLSSEIPNQREQDIQIYLAIQRSLLKADTGILRYLLLTQALPGWFRSDPEAVRTFVNDYARLRHSVDAHVSHPLAGRIERFVRGFSVLFMVLRDVLEQYGKNFRSLLDDPEDFRDQIRKAFKKRYEAAQLRIRRSYVRMVLYVFITKMLIALLLELPYDFFLAATTNYLPLVINIVFHPFLMFAIAVSIDLPSKKNTDRVAQLIEKIVREDPKPGLLRQEPKRFARSAFFTNVFRVFSVITFVASFGIIIWILRLLHFHAVGVAIFLFFLAIVSFLGMKLRSDVRDFVIVDRRPNTFTMLFDFFTVPLLSAGRWISEKAPKVNVFLFVLDVIIEAPFKFLVELFEEWGTFQRERKEELY